MKYECIKCLKLCNDKNIIIANESDYGGENVVFYCAKCYEKERYEDND